MTIADAMESAAAAPAEGGDRPENMTKYRPRRRYTDKVLSGLRMHVRRRNTVDGDALSDWQADYLLIVGQLLEAEGLPEADILPLREVAGSIRHSRAPAQIDPDRHFAEEYARESATISYLILTGVKEADAAQRVARDMFIRGVPLPTQGGDARGWKRLLEFRDKLRHGLLPQAIMKTYQDELDRLKRERRV